MFSKIIASAAIGLLTAGACQAATLQDDVGSMLGTMKTVYSAYYAPAAWKKQYAGYDLNASYNAALTQAASKSNALTMKQARSIFKDFVYAMKDYHTSISFVSTETASLPLTVRGAEGRLFIVDIDRSKLSETAFPFDIGDELLTIDGRSANDVVNELQANFAPNAAATDRSMAELRLFSRSASRGFNDIPSGPVNLGIRRAGNSSFIHSTSLVLHARANQPAHRFFVGDGDPQFRAEKLSFQSSNGRSQRVERSSSERALRARRPLKFFTGSWHQNLGVSERR